MSYSENSRAPLTRTLSHFVGEGPTSDHLSLAAYLTRNAGGAFHIGIHHGEHLPGNLLRLLPWLDRAGNHAKERVEAPPNAREGGEALGSAAGEFRTQVAELEPNLARGDRDANPGPPAPALFRRKAVAAAACLGEKFGEVRADGRERRGMPTEAFELGVTAIAAGPTGEDGAGKERLSPAGEEPLPIKQRGVERPESHSVPVSYLPMRTMMSETLSGAPAAKVSWSR